jgi:alpha-glucoside transport system substrate-binding protein
MRKRKGWQAVAVVALTALTTAGCLSEGGDGGGGGGGGSGEGDGTVEIVYGFGGSQSEGFNQSLEAFQEESGIEIKLTEASQSFDTLIRTRVQANNLPDMALFPQPGVLKDFVGQDKMQSLGDVTDVDALEEAFVPGILEAATVDGEVYGAPVSMNVKSLVFYPKAAFEEAGYEIPTTLDGLQELTEQIKADGTTPWCVGMESGSATGWVATDWLEDMMLRVGGPDTYDEWVNHEIPFDDPVVKEAAERFESLALADGNVLGGRQGVVSTAFATSANPMFDDPPKCFLHRQGNFITQEGFFPEDVVANIDEEVGVFYLPGETEDDKPVLGGGDFAAVFDGADPEAAEVLEFITGEDYPGWSESAGFMSPRKEFDLEQYDSELMKQMAGIAYEADVFRFDGSDQMPGTVGSGSFWKGMVSWVSGQSDIDQALTGIEESWPSS